MSVGWGVEGGVAVGRKMWDFVALFYCVVRQGWGGGGGEVDAHGARQRGHSLKGNKYRGG